MSLLTIGAFAAASRLPPKALRLYDELALLRPVEAQRSAGGAGCCRPAGQRGYQGSGRTCHCTR